MAAGAKPSSLVDTRVVYCDDRTRDDCRATAPVAAAGGAPALQRPAFKDRHESTRAYIDYMRPRCVELARVLKKTGSFYYHCDWHASHYVKVMAR